MDVEIIKQLKQQLETNMLKQIRDFVELTGAHISGIHLDRNFYYFPDVGKQFIYEKVHVDVEIL